MSYLDILGDDGDDEDERSPMLYPNKSKSKLSLQKSQ